MHVFSGVRMVVQRMKMVILVVGMRTVIFGFIDENCKIGGRDENCKIGGRDVNARIVERLLPFYSGEYLLPIQIATPRQE